MIASSERTSPFFFFETTTSAFPRVLGTDLYSFGGFLAHCPFSDLLFLRPGPPLSFRKLRSNMPPFCYADLFLSSCSFFFPLKAKHRPANEALFPPLSPALTYAEIVSSYFRKFNTLRLLLWRKLQFLLLVDCDFFGRAFFLTSPACHLPLIPSLFIFSFPFERTIHDQPTQSTCFFIGAGFCLRLARFVCGPGPFLSSSPPPRIFLFLSMVSSHRITPPLFWVCF